MIFDGCFACPQDVDNRCGDSHWRAANNHGRKAAKLDETGLQIAGQNEKYLVINVSGLKIFSCSWKRYIWCIVLVYSLNIFMNCDSTRNSVQGLQSVILLINDTSLTY